jgi:hypothetical protein
MSRVPFYMLLSLQGIVCAIMWHDAVATTFDMAFAACADVVCN